MKILVILAVWFGLLVASVDINIAGVKELSSLKGIGLTKAKAIIEYRKINCFKSVDELTHVKGIGKKTVEKNKQNITVSECK